MESTVGFASTGAALDPGDRLGRYQIVRRLGAGGMGAVYEAKDLDSDRRIALKVLNHTLQSPQQRQRFLREGRLAASINHPNSVYIFGTDEIDGTPVISMELVESGTLQDRVRDAGPLPVGVAVDCILDVIAGLETASEAGVLHRDVKPANCFVATDGTVKVGDFGLSISTELRNEQNLTQSGIFLGTPAFASPEQLRGDELDVRADIYSVGVTLFYLLTGKPPFVANQMVQLLATVLEQPAPSPADLRPDLPAGLALVVQRCLQKRKEQRFENYQQLREALLPYRTAACSPATVGFRILASVTDFFVLLSIAALVPLLWVRDTQTWFTHFLAFSSFGPQTSALLNVVSLAGAILFFVYFTVSEGIWGASVGKRCCQLKVIGPDRDVPGLGKAAVRTLVFCAASWAPWWILWAVNAPLAVQAFDFAIDSVPGKTLSVLCGSAFLLLFVTIRRRNGFAGVHELLSQTRVIRRPNLEPRPTIAADDRSWSLESESKIGPYEVLETLETTSTSEIKLAYDARLLRKVWLRTYSSADGHLDPTVRDISRVGRLRWLNGHREQDSGWDAFEAPSGRPFLDLVGEPQPWNAVRFWLYDVAGELAAGERDQSLPSALRLDRVWITSEGRAVLLDFTAPGAGAPGSDMATGTTHSSASAAAFVRRIAFAALESKFLVDERALQQTLLCQIPLTARAVLTELDASTPAAVIEQRLKPLIERPVTLSLRRRAATLVGACAFPFTLCLFFLLFVISERGFLREYPELGRLAGYVELYRIHQGEQSATDRTDGSGEGESTDGARRQDATPDNVLTAIEVVIAARFADVVQNEDAWRDPTAEEFVSQEDRELLLQFLDEHPAPTEKQLQAAERVLRPYQPSLNLLSWSENDYVIFGSLPAFVIGAFWTLLILTAAIPSIVCALLLGTTPLLYALEIDIVDRHGLPASRLRLLVRSVLLWLLVSTCLLGLILISIRGRPRVGLFFLSYWIVLLFTSERALHDRLAGTWMLPR